MTQRGLIDTIFYLHPILIVAYYRNGFKGLEKGSTIKNNVYRTLKKILNKKNPQ